MLSLVSLLTIIALGFVIETVARLCFTESATTTFNCLVVNDPTTGVRGVPNTTCSQKIFESNLVTYKINSCGHRAAMDCGPKPAGTFRIVMVGSSFNYGMWVSEEESFAALLPKELSRRTGRNVELYNEAMQWGFPRSVTLRFNDVLVERPDMIFWPITPMDIGSVEQTLPYSPPLLNTANSARTSENVINTVGDVYHRFAVTLRSKSPSELMRSLWDRISSVFANSRSIFMLQHFLFESQSQYVKQYLIRGESSDYLRSTQSAFWRENLSKFERYYTEAQIKADRAGAQLVVVMLPARAQAAMISMNEWPPGFDPYKLDNEVRSVVAAHGGTYVDILADFRDVPNPELLYLAVDGHPDAAWHSLVSRMLARALTAGSVSGLEIGGDLRSDIGQVK